MPKSRSFTSPLAVTRINDEVAVGEADGRAHVQKETQHSGNAEIAAEGVEIKRLAIDEFHHEIEEAVVGSPAIEQCGDIGMIQLSEDLALAVEGSKEVFGKHGAGDHLDGDGFAVGVISATGFKDGAHAAAAYLTGDLVGA
jgi:hypothetical protein